MGIQCRWFAKEFISEEWTLIGHSITNLVIPSPVPQIDEEIERVRLYR